MVKRHWGGPLVLKGILDVEDAKIAAQSGADAIVVFPTTAGASSTGRCHRSARCEIAACRRRHDRRLVRRRIRSGQSLPSRRFALARSRADRRASSTAWARWVNPVVLQALQLMQKELDVTMALTGIRRHQGLQPRASCALIKRCGRQASSKLSFQR